METTNINPSITNGRRSLLLVSSWWLLCFATWPSTMCNAESMYIFSVDRFPACFDFHSHLETEIGITLVSTTTNSSFLFFKKNLFYPTIPLIRSTSVLSNRTQLNVSHKESRYFQAIFDDTGVETDVTITPVPGEGHHVSMSLVFTKENPHVVNIFEVFVRLNQASPFFCPHAIISKREFRFDDLAADGQHQSMKINRSPVNQEKHRRKRRSVTTTDVKREFRIYDLAADGLHQSMKINRFPVNHEQHRRKRRSVSISAKTDRTYNIELYVVMDHTLYMLFNKDTDALMARSRDIVNQLDTIFRRHRIRVHLVGVEIWSKGDRIDFTKNSGHVLSRFSRYSALERFAKADHVHFLSGRNNYFEEGVVGKAYHDMMCSITHSAGFTTDSPVHNVKRAALIMAHEMGHSLGMLHDELNCACAESHACIMSAYVPTLTPRFFSSCSLDRLNKYLVSFKSKCMLNKPTETVLHNVINKRCGNNIVDQGEECDCGDPYFCKNPCCNPWTCRYTREGSQCFEGGCCTKDCKLKAPDTVCRNVTNYDGESSCDLTDHCNGLTPDCPNIHKENGISCTSGGICYDGECRSHQYQCEKLWGKGAKRAHVECYKRINRAGRWFGHCGSTSEGKKHFPCSVQNTMCGVLQCTDRPTTYPLIGWRTGYGETTLTAFGYKCQMAQYGVGGRGEQEPSMVQDWTPCGEDRVCLGSRCVPKPHLQTKCTNCSTMTGTCTNQGTCFCHRGWTGHNCSMNATEIALTSSKTVKFFVKVNTTNTSEANKKNANTSEANKKNTNTSEANKKNTNTSEANKKNTNTSEANKKNTNTSEANKKNTNTSEANKKNTNTSEANKKNTNTSEANKKNTNTSEANKKNTNTSEANKTVSSAAIKMKCIPRGPFTFLTVVISIIMYTNYYITL